MRHGEVEKAVARGVSMQLPHRMASEVSIPDIGRDGRQIARRADTSNRRMERERDTGTEVMKDHVHMVVIVPPKVSISELMEILRGRRRLDYSRATGI